MEKAKIIIVEDEAIIGIEIEQQLQSLGYEVTSIVDTGEYAIKKAEEDKPDLILMDIRIKGDMDGIETAEEIRNRFGIPVIFSTAYLDQERIERAKITMPFGYVLKPIQERDLKVTIEMALYVSEVDAERRKAEENLKKAHEELLQKSIELSKVNENLHVYQIELEEQNEELKRTQNQHAEIQSRYFDLYNFAPVGYLTFNKKGIIIEANLTCTAMLGCEKSMLKNLRFSNFIEEGSQDSFYFHKRQAIETKNQQSCELQLVRKDKSKFWARLESKAVFNDKGEFIELNTNLIEIDEPK
jgi:PAS domain S-box-containing protein